MKKIFFSLFFCFVASSTFCQQTYLDKAIEKTISPAGWIIHTKSSSYQIIINENKQVIPVFYGNAAGASLNMKPSWNNKIPEVPVRGGFANKTPAVEVIFEDQVRDIEWEYIKGEIIDIDGFPALKIYQKDKVYPIEVISYIRVIPQWDIIEKWTELYNISKAPIEIENFQSASIFLPADSYELNYFSGYWEHEYQPQVTTLNPGTFTMQVKDFKSYSIPFFMVGKENTIRDTLGNIWFGSLEYSGNWRMDFNKFPEGGLQVTGGINFWDTRWNLQPSTHFITPKFIFGYTEKGKQGVSLNLKGYEREFVMPKNTVNKSRPVIYNSWYATAFKVNEKDQLELAAIAKSIGVEMFVIDDGWFKGRVNDAGGLGDWTVDYNKFPEGLNPLIQKINNMGLDFGIWVEPEMVNPNSDLYRNNPDWVLYFPTRTREESRNQLVLNLARDDVYNYLYNSLYDLLKNHNIKYLKWDMNRAISQPGWPSAATAQQREVRIRYVNNLYKLIDTLRKNFPGVWIENCSSGGGRVDLGMLSRTDAFWASDNTDPVDRLFIQYSYLQALPANTMISWTTDDDAHNQNPSLSFRFDVAMSGVLGVGNNIAKWSETDKKIATEKIAKYKQIRPLLSNGDLYRLVSPYENNKCALQFMAKDKSQGALYLYNLNENIQGSTRDTRNSKILLLRGLNEESSYKIEGDEQIYKGSFLMKSGINWPVSGSYQSKIIEIKMIN